MPTRLVSLSWGTSEYLEPECPNLYMVCWMLLSNQNPGGIGWGNNGMVAGCYGNTQSEQHEVELYAPNKPLLCLRCGISSCTTFVSHILVANCAVILFHTMVCLIKQSVHYAHHTWNPTGSLVIPDWLLLCSYTCLSMTASNELPSACTTCSKAFGQWKPDRFALCGSKS